MDNKLKIKLGAIFIGVGITIFLIIIGSAQIPGIQMPQGIIIIYMISISLPFVGYGFLMSGLSYTNKGIMLIITGIIFMLPMWIHGTILLVNQPIAWVDLIIAIYITLHLFLMLIFIFPAIYLIYTHIPSPKVQYYSPLVGWSIGITILTLICTTIVTTAGGAIATSSHDIDFRDYFFNSFGFCLGLGFLLSNLLIGLGYILQGAGVSGYSIPSGASIPTS
ncbi:MAG: hypothetical protein ACFE9T_13965 [Promethearchaeota archaeon]